MWLLLKARIVFINGSYVATPIAIVLWMISSKFKGVEVLLSTLLRYLFMPMMYMISLAVTSLVIKAVGSNDTFIVIALLATVYQLAEKLMESFHIMPNLRDSSGAIASVVAGAVMTMMVLKSTGGANGARGPGPAPSPGGGLMQMAKNTANRVVNSNSTMRSAKQSVSNIIGQSKGLQTAGSMARSSSTALKMTGGVAGKVMSSPLVRGGAGILAGASLTAVTGNPALGIAGYTGVSGILGGAGRGLSNFSSRGPSGLPAGGGPGNINQANPSGASPLERGRASGNGNRMNGQVRRNSNLQRERSRTNFNNSDLKNHSRR